MFGSPEGWVSATLLTVAIYLQLASLLETQPLRFFVCRINVPLPYGPYEAGDWLARSTFFMRLAAKRLLIQEVAWSRTDPSLVNISRSATDCVANLGRATGLAVFHDKPGNYDFVPVTVNLSLNRPILYPKRDFRVFGSHDLAAKGLRTR
jgi:hypothetical protein